MKNIKTFILGGIITLILGIGLIAGGIIYNNNANYKKNTWTHVQAQVVGSASGYREENGLRETVYYAVVEYTVDGHTYKKQEGQHSRLRPSVGSLREIAYNPDNPQESIFVSESSPMIMIILCVAGGAFVFAGLLCLVTYGRKRK